MTLIKLLIVAWFGVGIALVRDLVLGDFDLVFVRVINGQQ
jgi:hypothetical protein